MTSTPRVTVVGSINADLVLGVSRLPSAGETVTGVDPVWLPGGKGANQALAAARIGAHVRMIGAVGNDAQADMALGNLVEAGVDCSGVERLTGPTGIAVVLVDEGGENQIVVAPGANAQVHVGALPGADVLVLQNEIPSDVVDQAIASARGLVIYNPAPVREWPAQIDLVDFVIVNEHEFAAYGEIPAREVIVTAGAGDVIAYRDGREIARVSPPRVTPIDTVGAGDTFVGVFAAMFAQTSDLQTSLHKASHAAALATLALGAQSAIPTAKQVDAFIESQL